MKVYPDGDGPSRLPAADGFGLRIAIGVAPIKRLGGFDVELVIDEVVKDLEKSRCCLFGHVCLAFGIVSVLQITYDFRFVKSNPASVICYDFRMLTRKDIDNLAELARLEIPDDEKEILRKEVDSILGYVGEIQKLSGGEVKKEAGPVRNVFREDKDPHLPGEFTQDLLEEAPRRQDDFVKVKKIL